jgi:mRNA-degrading endonuclease RelE of RelBE toxin-antitoxin system
MASYRVEVTEEARREVRQLPGNVRQRVVRLLRALEAEPRPESSRPLDTAKLGIALEPGTEPRRIRLASWRLVYVVEDKSTLVSVLAIRKRPPYQYDDLEELIRSV